LPRRTGVSRRLQAVFGEPAKQLRYLVEIATARHEIVVEATDARLDHRLNAASSRIQERTNAPGQSGESARANRHRGQNEVTRERLNVRDPARIEACRRSDVLIKGDRAGADSPPAFRCGSAVFAIATGH